MPKSFNLYLSSLAPVEPHHKREGRVWPGRKGSLKVDGSASLSYSDAFLPVFTHCSRWTAVRSSTAPLVAVAGNVYGGAPSAVRDRAIDSAPHLCGTVGLPGETVPGQWQDSAGPLPPSALIIPPIRPEKGQMLMQLRNGPSFLLIPQSPTAKSLKGLYYGHSQI